jgi:hypothetical protein
MDAGYTGAGYGRAMALPVKPRDGSDGVAPVNRLVDEPVDDGKEIRTWNKPAAPEPSFKDEVARIVREGQAKLGRPVPAPLPPRVELAFESSRLDTKPAADAKTKPNFLKTAAEIAAEKANLDTTPRTKLRIVIDHKRSRVYLADPDGHEVMGLASMSWKTVTDPVQSSVLGSAKTVNLPRSKPVVVAQVELVGLDIEVIVPSEETEYYRQNPGEFLQGQVGAPILREEKPQPVTPGGLSLEEMWEAMGRMTPDQMEEVKRKMHLLTSMPGLAGLTDAAAFLDSPFLPVFGQNRRGPEAAPSIDIRITDEVYLDAAFVVGSLEIVDALRSRPELAELLNESLDAMRAAGYQEPACALGILEGLTGDKMLLCLVRDDGCVEDLQQRRFDDFLDWWAKNAARAGGLLDFDLNRSSGRV